MPLRWGSLEIRTADMQTDGVNPLPITNVLYNEMLKKESEQIITDKDEQQEIVKLYNDWRDDTMFSSHIDGNNKYLAKLVEYCKNHKQIMIDYFLDMVNDLGSSEHFLIVVTTVCPNIVKVDGYMPFNIMEQILVNLLKDINVIKSEIENETL